eukprot:IDg22108t1
MRKVHESLITSDTRLHKFFSDYRQQPERGMASKSANPDLDKLSALGFHFVKLQTLFGMSPNSDCTALYDVYADVNCAGIRNAANFAIGSQSEDAILTFLHSHVTMSTNGKSSQISVPSKISRGQSRAHEALQRDLVPCFYRNCPEHCLFKTDSVSSKEEKAMYARAVLKCDQHKKSTDYEFAWLKACQMARSKARFAAKSTIREILDKRPQADIPPVWREDGQTGDINRSYMSVCGFAFCVTRGQFDSALRAERATQRRHLTSERVAKLREERISGTRKHTYNGGAFTAKLSYTVPQRSAATRPHGAHGARAVARNAPWI